MVRFICHHFKMIIILVLILMGAGYFSWKASLDKPIQYLTEAASIQDISVSVLADGVLEAAKQVSVGSQVSGQIKKLHIALGDMVEKGDLLIEIDDLPQQNALADAKARLKNIEATKAAKIANLENAKLTFSRQNVLSKNGASKVSELDIARANLAALVAEIDAIDAQISQAKIALNTATLNLGYTKITAPMSGMVVALVVEEGQTVNSVQSAPTLIKIATLSTMTVKAQISEADVIKVKVGLPVYFTILGDKRRYHATLRQIEPAPESIKTDVKVSNTVEAIYYNGLFDVKNEDQKLRISMTAQVVIVIDEVKDALVMPASALPNLGKLNRKASQTLASNKVMVRVLNQDGQVEDRQVVLGLNNNIYVQVLSGLKKGDHVVISDSSRISTSESSQMPKKGIRKL